MNVEIRPCKDEQELKSYADVVGYVFAVNNPADMQREIDATKPEWTMCAFENGRAVSTWGAFPFTVRLNGAPVEMGGVTAVGSLPGYRRRGLLRQTMTAGLHAMEEQRKPFAILWASMGAIYQRFGYGLASPAISYNFDPSEVELLPGPAPTGRSGLVPTDGALDTIRPIYEAFASPRNLLIERPDFLWKMGPLRTEEKQKLYVAVYRNGEGEARGYMVYTTKEEDDPNLLGPNQDMTVKDLVWLDLDAYRGLWEYIRAHDLVREVKMHGLVAEDDPMQAMLLEPRMLGKRVYDGIWMRVVNVERALASRPYAGAGNLCIDIKDELLPWNAGRWLMETDGNNTAVTRTTRDPDLIMPAATLATLTSGHRNATFCARAGKLDASDEAALIRADRIFATAYAPYTPNDF